MPKLLTKGSLSAIRRTARQFTNRTQGIAAVEFGLMAPFLLIMMLGVLDYGAAIYRDMQVKNAAQAGAQYAMINGFKEDLISSAVVNATSYSKIAVSPAPFQFCGCPSATGIATATCNSTCGGGLIAGTYVTVSAQGVYNPIFPYPLMPESITYKARSTVRIP